jgi:hypothetical protein
MERSISLIDLEAMTRELKKDPGPLQKTFNSQPRHDEIRRGLEELDRLIVENDQLRTERDSYRIDREVLARECEAAKSLHRQDREALVQQLDRMRASRDYFMRAFTELRATLEGFVSYVETGAKMQREFSERGAMMLRDAIGAAQSRAFGERSPQPQGAPEEDPPRALPSIVAQGPAPAA